jgi:GGDEF domain-containing protein
VKTVVLRKAAAEAFAYAGRLRTQIASAPLAHDGVMLGHVTTSLGLAMSPRDGQRP